MDGWMDGWLVGWLVGWLAGWLVSLFIWRAWYPREILAKVAGFLGESRTADLSNTN
jgi:hypothetical protein